MTKNKIEFQAEIKEIKAKDTASHDREYVVKFRTDEGQVLLMQDAIASKAVKFVA